MIDTAENFDSLAETSPQPSTNPDSGVQNTIPEKEGHWHDLVHQAHPIAKRVAAKRTRGLPPHLQDEIISVVNVALVEAAKKHTGSTEDFLKKIGLRLIGAIKDYWREERIIPRRSQEIAAKIRKVQEENPHYSLKEVAHVLKMCEKTVQTTISITQYRFLSLELTKKKDNGQLLHDGENPEAVLLKNEREHWLTRAIDCLTDPREKEICTLYRQGIQQRKIARYMGITETRVSQLLKRIRGQLEDWIEQYTY